MPNTLGSQIRKLRLKKYGQSFLEIAKLSGISDVGICLIEIGRTKNPGIYSIQAIAKALGTTVEFLLTGEIDE